MFEFFHVLSEDNAIVILKKDHDKVKALFDEFEDTDDFRRKKEIVSEAIEELKIHATIEEEIFYPAVRREMNEKDIMNEADEEHHVAKLLIAELDQMKGTEDHFEAKFIVLSENIRHHIREEEGEMFPKVRGLDLDLEELGQRLLARKRELKHTGVPVSDEEQMIALFGAKADSPARNARKNPARAAAKKSAKRDYSKQVAPKKKASATGAKTSRRKQVPA